MAAEWLAFMTPFVLNSPDQYRPQGPPALNSGKYTKDYKEVKRLGGDVNSERTQEQTDIAIFWNLNYFSQRTSALRDIAAAHVDDIADSARLFALADIAMADAVITAWDSKRYFVYWRPVTAIQEGDNDGNPRTHGDVNWHPFINTPPYPDYSSGANNVTGAVTKSSQALLREGQVHLRREESPRHSPTRTYTRFSDAAADVVEARILEGIHFRTADLVGRRQGRHVARFLFKHSLRPVGDHDGDCNDEEDDEDE